MSGFHSVANQSRRFLQSKYRNITKMLRDEAKNCEVDSQGHLALHYELCGDKMDIIFRSNPGPSQ